MTWQYERPHRGGARGRAVSDGPVVEIPPDVYVRLQALVDAAPGEVSGFGLVDVVGDRLVVREVFCPRQTCTYTSTQVDAEALADLLIELVHTGADPGSLRLWWHSHVDFEAYMSTVDRATLSSSFPEADWVLGLVLNRAGDVVAALEAFRPVPLRVDGLAVRLHVPADVRAAADAEVRAVVGPGAAHPAAAAGCAAPGNGVAAAGACVDAGEVRR